MWIWISLLWPVVTEMGPWAGLHDNVSDRPSAKVASVGCQLAIMALKIKTVTMAEVVKTQTGMPVHMGGVTRDWLTFCHLGSKSAVTLSCNPALESKPCGREYSLDSIFIQGAVELQQLLHAILHRQGVGHQVNVEDSLHQQPGEQQQPNGNQLKQKNRPPSVSHQIFKILGFTPKTLFHTTNDVSY